MRPIDPQKEARVWQRVQGSREAPPDAPRDMNLQGLIMNEWTAAATYLQLARQVPAKEAAVLQRLFREEQTHAACLKGIYTLITGERPVIQTPPPSRESVEMTLRKCYGAEMRSLMEYENRAADSEYGPVFAKLAEQEREHCKAVLELIGGLERK